MARKENLKSQFLFSIIFAILFSWHIASAAPLEGSKDGSCAANLVTKDQRRTLVSTDFGEISAVEISDINQKTYHLQFITLDPNSVLLPVLLHADMVFFVDTGSGSLSWSGDDERNKIRLRPGDVYRVPAGAVFFVRSSLGSTRERLRIYAMFADIDIQNPYESYVGAYSMLSDVVLGFDDKTLQSAFEVPEEVVEGITSGTRPPAILHVTPKNETEQSDVENGEDGITEPVIIPATQLTNSKKKTFNLYKAKPDVENCHGSSIAVNRKDLKALKGSNFGFFMVNLTQGSMMGPHWNPRATEIAIVRQGMGMIRVVCPSSTSGKANESANESKCKNMRFRVREGDVFLVSRFHPMAQMSFNNERLEFVGFSTMAVSNYPQFLAGKKSVLNTLDRDVVAAAFNAENTTIERLLTSQHKSIILGCNSCAEEEEAALEKEIEKERQEEEERKREEEEAKRREEEEEARRREEEEAKRKEEEERKREEEEDRRREEEEEEEARRKEEEKRKREEEEARRRGKQERKRQEEEVRRREEEEEEAARRREEKERKRQEEEVRRREEEEEEEEARREEEEEEEEAHQRAGQRKRERDRRRQEDEEEYGRPIPHRRRREEEEYGRPEEEEEQYGRPEPRERWSEGEEDEYGRPEPQETWSEDEDEGQRRGGEGEWLQEGRGEARKVLNRKWRSQKSVE